MSDEAGKTTAPLRISEPGIYDLTAAQYHADPCIEPSFSRSMAKLLCMDLSPAHVAAAHPRLGAGIELDIDEPVDPKTEVREDRDAGSAAHSIFLRGENIVERVPFDTYQTKAAKGLRDEIVAAGKIPLKQNKYAEVMQLVDALENYRARTGAFTKGSPERTLIWKDGPIWSRCMVDWLPDDGSAPLEDLKTTGGRAVRSVWQRRCFESGNDLQAVMYTNGAAMLRDGEMPSGMLFHVAETKPPYGIRRFELSPAGYDIGADRLSWARDVWTRCMADGVWPNYNETEVEYVDPPPWILRDWDWRMRSSNIIAEIRAKREAAQAVAIRIAEQRNYGA